MSNQLTKFGSSGLRRTRRGKSLSPAKVLVYVLGLTACTSPVPSDQQPPSGGPEAGPAALSVTDDGKPLPNITSSISRLKWEWSADQATAVLRMERGPPLFSISCNAVANVLYFDRLAAAPTDGRSTLSLTSASRAASLPAGTAGNLGSTHWRASLPGSELPKAVFELFAGEDPVRITIADTTPVLAPPEGIATNALRACGADSRSSAPRGRT